MLFPTSNGLYNGCVLCWYEYVANAIDLSLDFNCAENGKGRYIFLC